MSTGQEKGHANHTMGGLRYPWQILERLGFPPASSGMFLFSSANI